VDTADLQLTTRQVLGPNIGKLRAVAAGMLVVGGILSVISAVMNLQAFFQSYLFSYIFWFGMTAGSFGLLVLHHTVGGGWAFTIRRLLEAAAHPKTWILCLVLLIPIAATAFFPEWGALYAADKLALPGPDYGWANAKAATDPILQFKAPLLNKTSFVVISLAFFLVWFGWSSRLIKLGDMQALRDDPAINRKLAYLGGFGILFHSLMVLFSCVIWVMSLTPHWLSSIFGLLFLASQALSTLSLMIVLMNFLAGDSALGRSIPKTYLRDLANLTLATVLLWAYMSFSQYLIQFSGNTLEEVPWFFARTQNPLWNITGLILIFGHFALPFLVLLTGDNIKKSWRRLAGVMGYILVARLFEQWWLVVPSFRSTPINMGLIGDIGLPLLLGGIWLLVWAGNVMEDKPVVPMHHPHVQAQLQEVLSHG
jgi:hypothetical protein